MRPLDRGLGDADTKLEQLAPDTLGAPQPIRGGHPPDQRERLGRHLRLRCRPRPRFPSLERAEPGGMPAQHGIQLDDQQRLPPGLDAAGKQDEDRPIGRRAARALDAAPEDDKLLAQEGVLGDKRGPTATLGSAGFVAVSRRCRSVRARDRPRWAPSQSRRVSMGGSSSGTGGDSAPAMAGALSEYRAALYQVKALLDSNGYSKRPTQRYRLVGSARTAAAGRARWARSARERWRRIRCQLSAWRTLNGVVKTITEGTA